MFTATSRTSKTLRSRSACRFASMLLVEAVEPGVTGPGGGDCSTLEPAPGLVLDASECCVPGVGSSAWPEQPASRAIVERLASDVRRFMAISFASQDAPPRPSEQSA